MFNNDKYCNTFMLMLFEIFFEILFEILVIDRNYKIKISQIEIKIKFNHF